MAIPTPTRRQKLKWFCVSYLPQGVPVFFRQRRLRRELARVSALYRATHDDSFRYEITQMESEYESLDTWRLECLARRYQILLPHTDNDWWTYNAEFDQSHLSHFGKAKLLDLIRQERTGRIQYWGPLLGGITGVVGAAVGLVTVIGHSDKEG